MYKNMEAKKESDRKYRIKNKERISKWQKEYHIKNRIKRKISARKLYIKNKDKIRKVNLKWRITHETEVRNLNLKKFNLSTEQYDEMLKAQNNKCAICGIDQSELKDRLSVDHDHKSNKNRGLLCHNCNVGIGHFRDSTELLNKAIKYLGGVI